MFKKVITILILLLLLAGAIYYWFFYRTQTTDTTTNPGTSTENGGFTPINRNPFGTNDNPNQNTGTSTQTTEETPAVNESYQVPKLRKLSDTPISGFAASTTASSSLVRFMDRGTGHVYEATDLSSTITKLSNTTLPKIYEAYFNKNGTSATIRYLKEDSDTITNFYAELRKTSSSTSETPMEIKGKFLSPNIGEVSVSPNGNQIFTWNIESGRGVGYISNFNEEKKTKLVDTPLTQVNIAWPETNNVALNTKASGLSGGFLYSIDTKTGVMKKLLSGRGLYGKISSDLSQVLYSTTNGSSVTTSILNIKDNTNQEVVFRTLADKCVWSAMRKNELYCAVPTDIPNALYPDDWYKGGVSFVDQIWFLDTTTGEVHLMANLLKLSNELIDATDLTLDNKDNFLYFINKNDLSLWALDLNQ